MTVVDELIRPEEDGSISFGNYGLKEKTKKSDVAIGGNTYKVKTFRQVTRLECNDALVYESEPGTAVKHFREDEDGLTFTVEGPEDAQIVLGLAENTSYRVTLGGEDQGLIETDMGGKLVLSVELQAAESIPVVVRKD